jgi:hypothetical protein
MNGLGGRVLFGGWPEEGDEMPRDFAYDLLCLNSLRAKRVCMAAPGCRKDGWMGANQRFGYRVLCCWKVNGGVNLA